ncbi:CPBP family intramembrane glutamic endopeptidase [Bacillus thermotolerans]|uniref:CAAX amino terminal protease family n=1 Tax=Bacillus thermotolerans TaxID=1221996 RepID=A0A0F5I8K5_BACTR|nr:CPBP family intramembrane glutamic endopeptidase [Bacillus thermotolerans]KKB33623.1 CAAX amino terminal protease family [Bacillus thermotolerans]KKB41773.1 CAAX amino terminal protease family [Bacillus thermotolerans]KKB44335.1 CAAX amino terminal protease family [Bacillus thermotolerans]
MEISLWVIILFALLYEPVIGYYDFQKFKQRAAVDPAARESYYAQIMTWLWVPALFILLIVALTDLTLQQIGLAMPTLGAGTLGSFATGAAYGAITVYALFLVYYVIGYHTSSKVRHRLTESRKKEMQKLTYTEILPVTDKEKKQWTYVSLTAGITEEIIYRGFLIFAFSYLFPTLSIWVVILAASVIFGLAHTYQGFWAGVVRTSIVGIVFSIIYVSLGSILPLIVLHFLLDYVAKLGEEDDREAAA